MEEKKKNQKEKQIMFLPSIRASRNPYVNELSSVSKIKNN